MDALVPDKPDVRMQAAAHFLRAQDKIHSNVLWPPVDLWGPKYANGASGHGPGVYLAGEEQR